MNRYLIIGASGFLGSYLYEYLRAKGDYVIGTALNNPNNGKYLLLDLGNFASILDTIRIAKPNIIIHSGGLTQTDYCESNKDYAHKINVIATKYLASLPKIKIIYFSSDYVFDGQKGYYEETDMPSPINYYGFTKLLAEQEVLKSENNLVIRVSGLYGFNANNNRFINMITSRKMIIAYSNLISTPTYLGDVCKLISLSDDLNGIVHLSGSERFSRYEFLRNFINSLKLDITVKPEKYSYIPQQARRPRDTSLISRRNIMKSRTFEEAINEIKEML